MDGKSWFEQAHPVNEKDHVNRPTKDLEVTRFAFEMACIQTVERLMNPPKECIHIVDPQVFEEGGFAVCGLCGNAIYVLPRSERNDS